MPDLKLEISADIGNTVQKVTAVKKEIIEIGEDAEKTGVELVDLGKDAEKAAIGIEKIVVPASKVQKELAKTAIESSKVDSSLKKVVPGVNQAGVALTNLG